MADLVKKGVRFYTIIIVVFGTAFATDTESTTTFFLSISPQQQLELPFNTTKYSASVVASPTGATVTISATGRPPAQALIREDHGSINMAVSTESANAIGPSRLPPGQHFHEPDTRFGPYFEEGEGPVNITAGVGSVVVLDCRIALLQDKTVTWLHHRPQSIHLLTVGRSAYSSDERITLSFRYPNNFRLEISFLTRRDEGLYECQVATHPPKVRKIYLKVKATPEVEIVDETGRIITERVYKPGSSLDLMCIGIQVGVDTKDTTIVWKRGNTVIKHGINFNISFNTDSVISTLTVSPMSKRHIGNYTCIIGNVSSNHVAVHVLNGETPAAVYHNAATGIDFAQMLFVLTLARAALSYR